MVQIKLTNKNIKMHAVICIATYLHEKRKTVRRWQKKVLAWVIFLFPAPPPERNGELARKLRRSYYGKWGFIEKVLREGLYDLHGGGERNKLLQNKVFESSLFFVGLFPGYSSTSKLIWDTVENLLSWERLSYFYTFPSAETLFTGSPSCVPGFEYVLWLVC